ncbi:MAG TPA: hypothetical protein VGE39_16260 [Prosthecobacter sp.]
MDLWSGDESSPSGESKELLRLANALAPVIGAPLGVRDSEDHDFLPPNHVGDVVFTKAWIQISPANGFAADVEKKRVFTDGMAMLKVAKFKRDHQFLINVAEVFQQLIMLTLGGRMDVPFGHGV